MKKKNIYYYETIQRVDASKLFFFRLFLSLSSWPRVLIEVFTRRGFGERYFSFSLCLFLAANLAALPFALPTYGSSFFGVIWGNITWYIYLVLFLIASFKRYLEVKHEPGVFDFAKFSLSPGIVIPQVREFRVFGRKLTTRTIATVIEPGLFGILGLILVSFEQKIGFVLLACSSIYSLSWRIQYYLGTHFIMDKIDEMICNEELVNTFVDKQLPEETRGFEVYGDAPRNSEFRRKVVENMFEDEPAVDVL